MAGLIHGELTDVILGAAIEVHGALGPGLLESAYEECLAYELALRSVPFRRQLPIPVEYKGTKLDCGFKVDLLIADAVVVELKSVERIHPIFEAQLLTYLKLTQKRVGLLLNFNTRTFADGIMRRVR